MSSSEDPVDPETHSAIASHVAGGSFYVILDVVVGIGNGRIGEMVCGIILEASLAEPVSGGSGIAQLDTCQVERRAENVDTLHYKHFSVCHSQCIRIDVEAEPDLVARRRRQVHLTKNFSCIIDDTRQTIITPSQRRRLSRGQIPPIGDRAIVFA